MAEFRHDDEARSYKADLFLIATGTLSTAHLPFWLNWLATNRPDYTVTAGLTDSAKEFVSPAALTALTGSPVVSNTWTTPDGLRPVHTSIAEGHDGIIVYPASVAFLSALASGSGDKPFTLAALGAQVPVVLAPSLPPGVADNPIVRGMLARLAEVPGYRLVPTRKKASSSVDREADVAAPLWEAVSAFEEAGQGTGGPQDGPAAGPAS